MRPLFVIEDTTRPRWKLFAFLGVEWWATRWAWAGPLLWVLLGWMVAWADPSEAGATFPSRIVSGTGFGVLLWLTNGVHTLGHVAASAMVGTPMDAVVVTSTRDVTVYRGSKREVPARVRALRSLGGPIANALVGGAALAAAAGLAPWLRAFGVFNLCIAAWTLAPVPTMDGWIVWRWIVRRGRTGS